MNAARTGCGPTVVVLLLAALFGCTEEPSREVVVFCAASAASAVEDIGILHRERTGVVVQVSAGASSTLARQIERGAPADVFISANPAWTAHLVDREIVAAHAPRELVANRLVVVRRRGDAPDDAEPFPPGLVAIGDPDHVPVGIYARAALEAAGRWGDVHDRLLPAVDARAALRLVELGEARSGVVYASDGAASPGVRVIAPLPLPGNETARYRIAALGRAGNDADDFVAFALGPEAAAIFRGAGFEPVARE